METGNAHSFVATQWSLVITARNRDCADARAAMEKLAQRYWYPLYAYIRRKGHSPANAEDLTQEFFRQFIEKEGLRSVDPSKGRFRAFLLACVNHFLSHERERAGAQKRGGDRKIVGLEAAESRYALEANSETAEKLFERRWALQVLDMVVARLGEEYADDRVLFAALLGVLTASSDSTYAQIGRSVGKSEGAVKTAAHRLRARYRDLLKDEIAQTVATDDEVAMEIQYLMRCL